MPEEIVQGMNGVEIVKKEVEIQTDKLTVRCQECQSQRFSIELNGPHASQICDDCGNHIDFVKQKNNSENATRDYRVKDVIEFRDYDYAFCFNCTRTKNQLGRKETLEVDHIKEICDGGEDRPKNLRVLCTKCHKQRNHNKTYLKDHLEKFYENGEQV